jgi:hypothetical protein
VTGDEMLDMAVTNGNSYDVWVFLNDCTTSCPADLNGNGYVGICDLLALIREWGPCS